MAPSALWPCLSGGECCSCVLSLAPPLSPRRRCGQHAAWQRCSPVRQRTLASAIASVRFPPSSLSHGEALSSLFRPFSKFRKSYKIVIVLSSWCSFSLSLVLVVFRCFRSPFLCNKSVEFHPSTTCVVIASFSPDPFPRLSFLFSGGLARNKW